MKTNRKILFCIAFLFLFLQVFSKVPTIYYKEDVEILKLEDQIKSLQDKVKTLKTEKAKRLKENKEDLKVALVLSGGGAKGFAHIGVLKELEKNHIKIDCITGNSIGAIIGALYSVGYTPDEIENIIKEFVDENFYNDNPNRTDLPLEKRLSEDQYAFSIKYDDKFNFYLPKGLKNSQKGYLRLKELLSRAENIRDFDKLPIPLRVVATDLDTGKAVTFKSGDLAKVVTASAAIPSFFDPVKIDGVYYVDGMLSRNFPVEDAINMGANIIIGVNIGANLNDNPNGKYNVFTIAQQLLAIQSASSTSFQKELVSILIEPKVNTFKSTDYDNADRMVKAGEEAFLENKDKFKNIPRKSIAKLRLNEKDLSFDKVVIDGVKDKNELEIVKNIVKQYKNKDITKEDMNTLSLKLYGLDFINKVYYENRNNTLYLTLEETPANTIGVGFDYQSNYYTSIKVGTDLNTIGKFGNFTNIYVEGGDYLGAGVNSLFYYGIKNKFGIKTSLKYGESPFYIYENNQRLARLKSRSIDFELSAFTQYLNEIVVSYGAIFRYGSYKDDINADSYDFIQRRKENNYGQGFLNFTWDKADSSCYAKEGFNNEINYFWGGSTDRKSSDFYGVAFSLERYEPITRKLTLDARLYGGSMNGTKIPYDEYIKFGGFNNSVKNKEFSFYGYNPQQRLLKNLFAGKLGLQYEFKPHFFLSGGVNVATFNKFSLKTEKEVDEDIIWEDYYTGVGVSLGYLSPVGPVEFSISKNNDFNEIVYQFSIGYTLD